MKIKIEKVLRIGSEYQLQKRIDFYNELFQAADQPEIEPDIFVRFTNIRWQESFYQIFCKRSKRDEAGGITNTALLIT